LHHANPKIAQRALDLGRVIHRAGRPRLRIKTLGAFQAWRGTSPMQEHDWGGRQPKLFLKNLIALGGLGVVKDKVLEDLWPKTTPVEAERGFKINL
jgi:hypothetical protein